VTLFHDRFVELYDMHFPHVRRFLNRLTGDQALSDDIAQDTFVRLFRRGAPPDEPAAWLITVALNLLRNIRSTDARRRNLLGLVRAEATVGDASRRPDEGAEAADVRRRVRAALARLPERDRQLLLLRAEGYRYQELGMALQLNPASVGVLLARAKRAFRLAYVEGGRDDAS